MQKAEITIINGDTVYAPAVLEGVTWTTERKTPGKLQFKAIADGALDVTEGNAVRLHVGGEGVFFGYLFTMQRGREPQVDVTAYDQMRYLLNKDTYVYDNKTAGDVLRMIAADFGLTVGDVSAARYVIPSRVEDNTTLLDIIHNALDLELTNTGTLYVLYDKYGALTLRALDDMRVPLVIDAQTAENYSYKSTIDDRTYNKIKLTYENKETGKREVYIVQHGENVNAWGVLQYYDTLKDGENGAAKAAALLGLYNAKTRKLSVTRAFGDIRVRAGSLLPVMLRFDDYEVKNYMLVEKCVHRWEDSLHTMDLTLRGGEVLA